MPGKNFLFLLAVPLCLASCVIRRYTYNPATIYNPVFAKKGESDATVRFTGGPYSATGTSSGHNRGNEVQAAYSVTKHLFIDGTYTHQSEKDAYDSLGPSMQSGYSDVNYERELWQAGAGYYYYFTDERSSIVISSYYGWGSSHIHELGRKDNANYSNFLNYKSQVFSVQPSVNFAVGSLVQPSLILRYTWVNNRDITTDYSADFIESSGLNHIEHLKYIAFGFNLAVCPKKVPWLKLQGQLLFTSNGETVDYPHYARTYNGSLGLSFDVSRMGRMR